MRTWNGCYVGLIVGLIALSAALPLHSQESGEPQAPAGESSGEDQAAEVVPTIPVKVAQQEEPLQADDAAESGATALDTIEVTASRRVKAQRDLPGSVGAIRGEDLEKMRAQGMADYLKLVPGVILIESAGENSSIPVIRGIATSLGSGVTQLTTGIYADDLPFSDLQQTTSIPDLAPFDFERVEVLKGPQGTLFGSGALAGAVRYILNKPQHSVWEGKLQLSGVQNSQSETPGGTFSGALNMPLFGDAVAIRLVGNYRDTPGWYDNTSRFPQEDVNNATQAGGRILVSWNASERLKLSGFYLTQASKVDDPGYATKDRDSFDRSDVPFQSPSKSSFGGANFLATYDFDWGTLLSSTNRIVKDVEGKADSARGLSLPRIDDPREPGEVVGAEDFDQTRSVATFNNELLAYTQEFRLSSTEDASGDWEWLVGAAYLDYRQNHMGDGYIGPVDRDSGGPVDQDDLNTLPIIPIETPLGRIYGLREAYFLQRNFDNKATEMALFGEATYRLGEHWEFTAGGRGFRTRYAGDHLLAGLQAPLLVQKFETTEHAEIDEHGINPKFSIRYKHDRNMQVYVLAAKGYQFGGIQLDPPNLFFDTAAEQQSGGQADENFNGFVPYKSSTLWNYELGLRTEWLERRLRFDVAFFYLDWANLQLQQAVVLDPTPDNPPGDPYPGQVLFAVIGNVGKAHSEGAELALEVSPVRGVLFRSSASWVSALTDVEYVDGNNQTVAPGTRLPGNSRFQIANTLSVGGPLPYFNNWEGGLSLTHSHLGSAPSSLRNPVIIRGYDTFDAGLTLGQSDAQWFPQIGFNINNLTDTRGVAQGSADTANAKTYIFVRPRTALLTLSWNY